MIDCVKLSPEITVESSCLLGASDANEAVLRTIEALDIGIFESFPVGSLIPKAANVFFS
jgi:hypothetical protein